MCFERFLGMEGRDSMWQLVKGIKKGRRVGSVFVRGWGTLKSQVFITKGDVGWIRRFLIFPEGMLV
jgi:hypothetical protein